MNRRAKVFTAVFLGITGLAIGLEIWASVDSNPDTIPWTWLLVNYVPWEVPLAVFGALVVWLPIHFYVRYRGKKRPNG